MSMWDGPPGRLIMIAAFGVVGRATVPPLACALSRSMSESARPAPNAPIARKLRRVSPSQKRCLEPRKFNIFIPLVDGNPSERPKRERIDFSLAGQAGLQGDQRG